jgi:hypothetical protein
MLASFVAICYLTDVICHDGAVVDVIYHDGAAISGWAYGGVGLHDVHASA